MGWRWGAWGVGLIAPKISSASGANPPRLGYSPSGAASPGVGGRSRSAMTFRSTSSQNLERQGFGRPALVHEPAPEHVHEQFAALPWRWQAGGQVRVLLITSRETRRWVIPKGWPMPDRSPDQAAAQEAYEEAGVVGEARPETLGAYVYDKRLRDGSVQPVTVQVFALEVYVERLAFPEQGQRDKRWLAPAEAAELVDEPALKAILRGFKPG